MAREPQPYMQNRELSWLTFNERVLEEARDPSNPLAERLKFVSIFTSNLDEFFMIRVGSLYDMAVMGDDQVDSRTGLLPSQQLEAIYRRAVLLMEQRDQVYAQLQTQLQAYGVCEVSPGQLAGKDKDFLKTYFKTQLLPILSPQIVDINHPFPHLQNKSVYVVARLHGKDRSLFGIVPVPPSAPEVVYLPGEGLRYVRTEQLLLDNLKRVFDPYGVAEKNCVCVTRNADIAPQDEGFDVDDDFRCQMQKLLHKRKRMAVVRLECAAPLSEALSAFLCKRCHVAPAQIFLSQAPMRMGFVHPMLKKLPEPLHSALLYPPFSPQTPPKPKRETYLHLVQRRDLLLSYPFESMEPFLRLIREAASDPSVLSIQITIYRLAQKARLVEYLCAAAENGKEVTAVIELRARFDEQNNIDWSERLEDAGCRVIYGFSDYKIHSKVCLITLKGKSGIQYVTQIGTGNYNEKTSEQYTDLSLITADQGIGRDAAEFFKNMAVGNLEGSYHNLLVSPSNLKQIILLLIGEETARGSHGRIIMKMNSLTDYDVMEKLAEASRAGVRVDLIIRGICCLRPGVPGHTEHISVTSVVGRFLEHSRIYSFGSGENQRLFLGSADMMTRNTQRRVEVICPVYATHTKARLNHILDILLRDTVKARALDSEGSYQKKVPAPGAPGLSSQDFFMDEAVRSCREVEFAARALPSGPLGGLLRRLRRRG
ncbi:polyphosphate kinase 1 [Lawsonibacter asaccharolyticus]|uniref:polyphosphate kinase 1 n=1 Tax=Lawsonibacter asaccharolyticus TaxID=2108523 RepID=UPI002659C411|nr:polyphosphate kinase 1 [Lawsonibacter asaccharolyticus]UMM46366.1 polyphosphate kinase 1 [Lawsonibacter asaccharolyticus]